jgi:hypothetical protein
VSGIGSKAEVAGRLKNVANDSQGKCPPTQDKNEGGVQLVALHFTGSVRNELSHSAFSVFPIHAAMRLAADRGQNGWAVANTTTVGKTYAHVSQADKAAALERLAEARMLQQRDENPRTSPRIGKLKAV